MVLIILVFHSTMSVCSVLKPSFGSWALSMLLLATLLATSSHSVLVASCAVVSTTSGLIAGHPAPNRTDVAEYLGIPYAQPPLGCLRFAAPQKLVSDAPFDAATFVSEIRLLVMAASGDRC